MKYFNFKYFFLIAVLLCCSSFSPSNAQLIPSQAEVQEIQAKLDKIKELKNQGKKDDDPEIKQLAKEAIELADKYYKIPSDNLDGEPQYDPKTRGEGSSGRSGPGNKKVKVKIGPKALAGSPGLLATTKHHEIVGHGGQAASTPSRWYTDPKGNEINEVEAYDEELKKAIEHGLSQAEIDEIKKRRKEHYESLDSANKARIDSIKNAGGVYTLALATATGTSKQVLGTGNAKLYVVSTVLAEDRMMLTVRKPGNLANLLITATVNGRSTTARTDVDGHALLDFSSIASGITASAIASISCTDINGSRLAVANSTVMPGFAWIFDRASTGNLPTDIINGTVITIRGNNLGADAQMACNSRMQETLAASSNEIIAFVDAPAGVGAAFVIGSSSVGESKVVTVKPSTNPILQVLQEQPFLIGGNPSPKTEGGATKTATTPSNSGTQRK